MPIHDRGGRRQLVLYWAVAAIAQVAIALLSVRYSESLGFGPRFSAFNDLTKYYIYARLMVDGSVPYRDFLVEYPPLAVPFFVAPMMLSGLVYEWYKVAFAAEMALASVLASWLVAREVERTSGIGRVPGRLAWYSTFLAILCPMAVTRFDLVPTLASFAAAVWLSRGRMVLGGLASGLGVLAKVTPGLVILPALATPGRRWPRVVAAVVFGLVVAGGLAGWYRVGGPRLVESLRYHSDRGVEIGSLSSSGFMVAHEVAGLPIKISYDHSSVNVIAAGAPIAARVAPLAQLACLLLVGLIARRGGPERVIRLAGASLLAYVVAGKVLSPQYVIWLIPFVAASGSTWARVVFLGCCVLTTAIFPWTFDDLVNFRRGPEALLLARNLGLVWLFAILMSPGSSEPLDGGKPSRDLEG